MDLGIRLISTLPRRPFVAFKRTISLCVLASAALACESTDDKTDAGPPPPPAGAVLIEDVNNYDSETSLTPTIVEVAASDLHIDWSALTVDMQCHGMDPAADIQKVGLLRFKTSDYEENTALLASGELDMSLLAGYIDFNTEGELTECDLSQLTNFGTVVDLDEQFVEDDTKGYMLTFGSSREPGQGTRTMVFLHPTDDNPVTDVTVGNACDEPILDFHADLGEPLAVPAGKTNFAWNKVTEDGLGNPISFPDIDRVLIGYYEETPEELVADIFDLELNAEDLWEILLPDGGRSVDLTNARHLDANGEPEEVFFESFDDRPAGTWLLALLCSDCQNPSPVVLTVLDPG